MSYKITLTDRQLRVIQYAVEEYLRLRMGQTFNFADDIASMGPHSLSNDFDEYLNNRDWIEEIMKSMFRMLWKPYGTPWEKTELMMVAEDIWNSIRNARGLCPFPLHLSTDPMPVIEEINDDSSGNS